MLKREPVEISPVSKPSLFQLLRKSYLSTPTFSVSQICAYALG
jgi:hypothetical protein